MTFIALNRSPIRSRREYVIIQLVLFGFASVGIFYSQVDYFELVFGILALLVCAIWLSVTRMNRIMIFAFVLSIIPMVLFDNSLDEVLGVAELVSRSNSFLTFVAGGVVSLVVYGWLIVVFSFFLNIPNEK